MSVTIGLIGNAMLHAPGELGAAANLAALIQGCGAQAALAGLVGDDRAGAAIRAELECLEVDVSRLRTVSAGITATAERAGARIALGDRIDVAGLFAMDAVLIAVSDIRLHRFLVDLPAHTLPNARLIGLINHLASNPSAEAREIMLAHDLIIATSSELKTLTAAASHEEALRSIQHTMIGKNLRDAAILGANGQAHFLTKIERLCVETKLEFDTFVAAASVAYAERRPWREAFAIGIGQ